MAASVADRLFDMLEPMAVRHGFELVAAEVVGSKGAPLVRVYLDRESGIDLDAIAEANAWISDALDDAPPVEGSYSLEVSSPGIERPLRRIADFERFVGERAVVKTQGPIDGRRSFTGEIIAPQEETIYLEVDGERVGIPRDLIAKANLKPEIDFGAE